MIASEGIARKQPWKQVIHCVSGILLTHELLKG